MSKTGTGAAIGAAAGAAAGLILGDDSAERKELALILGGVGALAGGAVGKMLDKRDQERLAVSTQETISTGQGQTWTNPETNVQAQTTVKATVTETQQVQIPILKEKVQKLPPLDLIGDDYGVTTNANVRGGPGKDYVVVDQLQAGQSVRVVGKVTGADWYLVAKDNVGSGFVATSLLASQPKAASVWAPAPAPASAPAAKAPAESVTQASVATTATCRVVTQQVTKNGQTATQDVKACRGPDGWRVVPA
jgi:surface antigen